MSEIVREIAELIDAEAHSGSASWDEINGPDATLTHLGSRSVVTLPAGEYDEEGDRWSSTITITIEEGTRA